MNKPSKPPGDGAREKPGSNGDSLAESSVNAGPAMPSGGPARDQGHHELTENDQRTGLEEAEKAGKSPAKP
ncbi:MAG: hypothetical protein JWM36_3837 [Hyphomicrobiales bacterium]|nr:hypothetical protein [Hyphomicrobiales bacterium]